MDRKFDLLLSIIGTHFGKRGAKIIVCLVLMVFGFKNSEIKDKFGVSFDALRKYRAALDSGHVDHLFVVHNDRRQKSELEQYNQEIMDEFELNPPKTLREAQARIKEMTGLSRSLYRIWVYLKKRGLKTEQ